MDKSLSNGKEGGGRYASRKLYKGNIMIKTSISIHRHLRSILYRYIILNLTDKNNLPMSVVCKNIFIHIACRLFGIFSCL